VCHARKKCIELDSKTCKRRREVAGAGHGMRAKSSPTPMVMARGWGQGAFLLPCLERACPPPPQSSLTLLKYYDPKWVSTTVKNLRGARASRGSMPSQRGPGRSLAPFHVNFGGVFGPEAGTGGRHRDRLGGACVSHAGTFAIPKHGYPPKHPRIHELMGVPSLHRCYKSHWLVGRNAGWRGNPTERK